MDFRERVGSGRRGIGILDGGEAFGAWANRWECAGVDLWDRRLVADDLCGTVGRAQAAADLASRLGSVLDARAFVVGDAGLRADPVSCRVQMGRAAGESVVDFVRPGRRDRFRGGCSATSHSETADDTRTARNDGRPDSVSVKDDAVPRGPIDRQAGRSTRCRLRTAQAVRRGSSEAAASVETRVRFPERVGKGLRERAAARSGREEVSCFGSFSFSGRDCQHHVQAGHSCSAGSGSVGQRASRERRNRCSLREAEVATRTDARESRRQSGRR